MDQCKIGLALFIFLVIPPVATFMESVMVMHMHMQMPMLIIAGLLMAPFFQQRFPRFFEKWNENGLPGVLLFIIIMVYWILPRTMDEALTLQSVEVFKFISLPFLAGVPLRDSWKKLSVVQKNTLIAFFTLVFIGMGLLYILAPVQLCNNYLLIEQIALGWAFVLTALGMVIYLLYVAFVDPSEYE
ncbi:hypothetical protein DS745_21110 [Anaerobacillus alkaliphilus]|uniref:Uncharacterized protein n=1 Tax=Anaerobacillus alkaliphilus TaxID=1548597 RepID=A0A4Q0VN58_9BACI|nr:hypothetical protein [Anaerobacillus alkaliphilus]RXI96242.1 hypothetical protein DS745_21110 [Anaerobacillus alkaliphilus]